MEYLYYMSEAPETVIKEDTNKKICFKKQRKKQRQKLINQQHKRVSKTRPNKKRTQMKNSLKNKADRMKTQKGKLYRLCKFNIEDVKI